MFNELIEQIGRERLEKIASWSDAYGRDVNVMLPASEAEAMARALLSVLDAKPIGWFTDDYKDDKSATTYSKDVADMWADKGWPVWEIYATPPAASEPVSNGYKLPDGWKLMPLKASPEILQAGIKAHYERQKQQQPEDVEFKGPMECAYDDMLSAAPAPGGE